MNCHFKRTLLATLVAQLFTVNAFADETPQADNATADTQTIVIDAKRIVGSVSKQTQEDAPNLVNVITAEEIRQLPDINAGEAVRRLPGISLEGDTGEGRYVYIRGLDADFNGTTFNGIRLLPTNPNSAVFSHGGGRAVAFDVIPSGMVGSIKVTKTNIPEQDAEAIGGTIEITSKQIPLDGKPFFNGHIGSGFEPLGNSTIGDFNFTAGTRFGGSGDKKEGEITSYSDKPFSIVVTGSYYEDSRVINDVEPSNNNGISGNGIPNGALPPWDERYYQYNRKRHGVGLDLGYQPDANNSYYFRAFDSGYNEKNQDNILTVDPTNGGNPGDNSNLSLTRSLVDHKETLESSTISLGGRNIFDDKTLDYFVAYGRGSYKINGDTTSSFGYNPGGQISYNNAGVGGTPLWQSNAANITASNYTLASMASTLGQTVDDEYTTGINFKLPVKFGDFQEETMKIGLNARFRTRDSGFNYYTDNGQLPAAPMSNFVSGPNVTFYNGQYNIGQLITPGVLQSLYPVTTLTVNKSALSQQHDTENVYASYAQYEFKQDRFSLIGGLRFEQTDAKYNANGLDGLGNIVPTSNTSKYGDLFPSIQAKYELDRSTYLRAAFSSTIARPTFAQVSPSVNGACVGSICTVSTGNPDLKAMTANSFDLSVERYLDNAGIASVGVFDKELSNYIASRTVTTFGNIIVPNTGGDTVLNTTFSNAGNAQVRGLELNYEQRYKMLPGLLSGLGTSFNYTYANSKFEEIPGVYSAVPGTSKNTYNASVFYDKDKFFFKLSAYYASASIWSLGNVLTSANTMYDDRLSIDIGAAYKYDKNISFYLSGKNLSNNPMTYYQGPKTNIIQREFYGATYLAGVNFTY